MWHGVHQIYITNVFHPHHYVFFQHKQRQFIGIELDKTYFEIAQSRIEEAIEKKEELLTTFDK